MKPTTFSYGILLSLFLGLTGCASSGITIPAGKTFAASMLTGAEASTSNAPQAFPPVLLKVGDDPLIPQDVRCTILGDAHGDLETGRVMARSQSLTCILPNGTAMSTVLKGYVVDGDGKPGVKGVLVKHQLSDSPFVDVDAGRAVSFVVTESVTVGNANQN